MTDKKLERCKILQAQIEHLNKEIARFDEFIHPNPENQNDSEIRYFIYKTGYQKEGNGGNSRVHVDSTIDFEKLIESQDLIVDVVELMVKHAIEMKGLLRIERDRLQEIYEEL